MRKGSKAVFNCPADVAYGSEGSQMVPPDWTIQFMIEVVDSKPVGWSPNQVVSKAQPEHETASAAEPVPEESVAPMLDMNEFGVEVYQAGDGEPVQKGGKVLAHYTGSLIDGTIFDSSLNRGRPYGFKVGDGRVIKCWDEGFEQLRKGDRAILKCPASYAYGEREKPNIPANSFLLFDVFVVDVMPPEPVPSLLSGAGTIVQ